MENLIMDLVPFAIVGYIRLSSPGFFDAMYHNALGFVVMSVCLGVYLAAVHMSGRILRIEV